MSLKDVDKNLQYATNCLMDILLKWNTKVSRNVQILGSVSEGAIISRMFFPTVNNETADHTITKELEIDIELLLGVLHKEHSHMLIPVAEKPGYVRLHINDRVDYNFLASISNLFGKWKRAAEDKCLSFHDLEKNLGFKFVNKNGFFLSHSAKGFYRQKHSSIRSSPIKRRISECVAAAMNTDPDNVTILRVGNDITKASLETVYSVFINDNKFVQLAIDNVGCIQFQWWPEDAEEWVTRERTWPSVETIEMLSSCCYIIAKPSNEEKDNLESTEWCYSFAHVEKELANRRSEQQKLIYLIIKSIFYKYMKPIDPEFITSYFLKTIMLWFCEEHPPDHRIWEIYFPSMINIIQYLFKRFKEALERKRLQHYFIPKINLIRSLPDGTRLALIDCINDIVAAT